jgi:hypothetical protein
MIATSVVTINENCVTEKYKGYTANVRTTHKEGHNMDIGK